MTRLQAKERRGLPAPPDAGRGQDSPLRPPDGTSPAHTLILDLWPLDCERVNFCCFKPPSLWSFVTQPQETDLTPTPVTPQGDRKAHAPSSLSSPPANKHRCPPGAEGPHGEPAEQRSQNRGHAPPLLREGATFRLEEGAGVSGQSGPHANPTTAFPRVCQGPT